MEKKVSVIVTCHNLEEYLDACIDSIKQQTYKAHEIILIHDGCTGQARAYTGCDTFFLDKNSGVANARDLGFRISTGDYILFFDGDDVMPLNYIEELVKVDADVVYPDCLVWVEWEGNPKNRNTVFSFPEKLTMKVLLKENKVLISSLFKRELYSKVNGFDPELEMFEDYDFWLKILQTGATFRKGNTILYYRQRANSRNHASDEKKYETYLKIVQRFTLKSDKGSKV